MTDLRDILFSLEAVIRERREADPPGHQRQRPHAAQPQFGEEEGAAPDEGQQDQQPPNPGGHRTRSHVEKFLPEKQNWAFG